LACRRNKQHGDGAYTFPFLFFDPVFFLHIAFLHLINPSIDLKNGKAFIPTKPPSTVDPVDSVEAEQHKIVASVKDPSPEARLVPASLPVPASLSVDPAAASLNKQDQ